MKINKILIILISIIVVTSCSDNENNNPQTNNNSLLIGQWKRISTENQNGNVTDDSSTCIITEFTENQYIVTDYIDADCLNEFSSGSLLYTKVDNFIYFGDINLDVKVLITELNESSLKLRSDYTDSQGNQFYDIVLYNKL